MLQRTYSAYVTTALTHLSAFVRSFAPVVAGALNGAARGHTLGVNVAADARASRCVAAWDALRTVQGAVQGHVASDDSSIARLAGGLADAMKRQLFTEEQLQARAGVVVTPP
jgi:hypothetical protein